MKFAKLCDIYEALGATSKRLEKTEILSKFLKEVDTQDKDVLYLLLGNIFPAYDSKEMGISSQTVIKAVAKIGGIAKFWIGLPPAADGRLPRLV